MLLSQVPSTLKMDHILTGWILSMVACQVGEHIHASVVQIKVEEKSQNSD